MAKIPSIRVDLNNYARPVGRVPQYAGYRVDWLVIPRQATIRRTRWTWLACRAVDREAFPCVCRASRSLGCPELNLDTSVALLLRLGLLASRRGQD